MEAEKKHNTFEEAKQILAAGAEITSKLVPSSAIETARDITSRKVTKIVRKVFRK